MSNFSYSIDCWCLKLNFHRQNCSFFIVCNTSLIVLRRARIPCTKMKNAILSFSISKCNLSSIDRGKPDLGAEKWRFDLANGGHNHVVIISYNCLCQLSAKLILDEVMERTIEYCLYLYLYLHSIAETQSYFTFERYSQIRSAICPWLNDLTADFQSRRNFFLYFLSAVLCEQCELFLSATEWGFSLHVLCVQIMAWKRRRKELKN